MTISGWSSACKNLSRRQQKSVFASWGSLWVPCDGNGRDAGGDGGAEMSMREADEVSDWTRSNGLSSSKSMVVV